MKYLLLILLTVGSVFAQGKKISEYPNTATIANTNLFLIADPSNSLGGGNTNYNVSLLQLRNNLVTLMSLPDISSLAYASSITLNVSTNANQWLVLAGNVTFSTTSVTSNRIVTIRIDSDSSDRTIIMPSGWRYMSGAVTNTLYATKIGTLTFKSYGTSDTNIIASWVSE